MLIISYSSYSLETFVVDRHRLAEIEPSYNALMDFEQVVLEMLVVVVASCQDENEVMEQHHYY
jgi:hypothetical protein